MARRLVAVPLELRRGIVAMVFGALVRGGGGLATGAVVGVGLALFARRRRRLRAPRVREDVCIEVLELAARGVRSGLAAPAALDEARQLVGGPVADAMPGGGTGRLGDRFDAWAASTATPAARVVAGAVGAAGAAGADPARAFEAAARALRARRSLRDEAAAAAAQARASAALMALAPVVVLGLSALTDPSFVSRSTHDPVALGCVALGLLSDVVGFWWMWRMVQALAGLH